MKKIGVYIHIPFCKSKCPYCDFYSLSCGQKEKSLFIASLKQEIGYYENVSADTLYIGGGTPSVLTGDEIYDIVTAAKEQFAFSGGEITLEANPSSLNAEFAEKAAAAGVNRFSLGVQSAIDGERKILGRKCSADEISKKIQMLKDVGIGNISLDVMLGVPHQSLSSLKETLDFCIESGVPHVSAYILKIEENTFFWKNRSRFPFPDEDSVADMYEFTCDHLAKNGLKQYEISNFARPGFESLHNLKYWNCEEYLGFGPAAHSFFKKRRFFHERDLAGYFADPLKTVDDGCGGDFEEYAMLKLRLAKGLREDEVQNDFGFPIPDKMRRNANSFADKALVISDETGIRITPKGFLVSNYIISHLF